MNISVVNIFLHLDQTTKVTFCGEAFIWWLPLAITCGVFVILHIISIIIIEVVLSKTLDPVQMLTISKSCFPTNLFEPIWSEEQNDILDPISDFLEEASKGINKGIL